MPPTPPQKKNSKNVFIYIILFLQFRFLKKSPEEIRFFCLKKHVQVTISRNTLPRNLSKNIWGEKTKHLLDIQIY